MSAWFFENESGATPKRPELFRLLDIAQSGDNFTGRVFSAINTMMLDMLAAVARKDYEDRRQSQGIEKARSEGVRRQSILDTAHKNIRCASGLLA